MALRSACHCPAGHELKLWLARSGSCDGCKRVVVDGEQVMDCRACNFYLCEDCRPAGGEVGETLWGAFSNLLFGDVCRAPETLHPGAAEIVVTTPPATKATAPRRPAAPRQAAASPPHGRVDEKEEEVAELVEAAEVVERPAHQTPGDVRQEAGLGHPEDLRQEEAEEHEGEEGEEQDEEVAQRSSRGPLPGPEKEHTDLLGLEDPRPAKAVLATKVPLDLLTGDVAKAAHLGGA